MDPIVGEFTITSGDDPSDFHTTFPRAIKLEDGYEIALKSISHGPVNNLTYSKVVFSSKTKSVELNLEQISKD